jgi:hypothetical protein
MRQTDIRWGIVSTILAPTADILRFVSWHLELGAHRIFIFLDDDNQDAFAALKPHPKLRVRICTEDWWTQRKRKRPEKHQVRQSLNANHAYSRKSGLDWLLHIDVDEYLAPRGPDVATQLASVPEAMTVARVRPMELLSDGDGQAYKTFIPPGPTRDTIVSDIYPTYGTYLRAGFLSHYGGKIFTRTGMDNISIRIHNAFQDKVRIDACHELVQMDLAHHHSLSWEDWHSRYRYRLEHGTYRAELDTSRAHKAGQMRLNDLFHYIEAENGTDGLRAFHREVAEDTPALRNKLSEHGVLRLVDIDLNAAVAKHFPGFI